MNRRPHTHLVAFLALALAGLLAAAAITGAGPAEKTAGVAKPAKPAAAMKSLTVETPSAAGVASPSSSDAEVAKDQALADKVFANLAKTYAHLDGVTVTMGTTPDKREAVAYYTEGQIVISTKHTVSIDEILAHEIWHVIDWRDNGRLDWGEDLPPHNSSDYLK